MAEKISLSNIQMTFKGGWNRRITFRRFPSSIQEYPEHNMFGDLPAYGLYCRHVRGLRLDQLDLSFDAPEDRPALICDDIEDLRISQFEARAGNLAIRLKGVRNALVQGCRAMPGVHTFLRVEGKTTGRVLLSGNDLSLAHQPLEVSDDVSKNAISLESY